MIDSQSKAPVAQRYAELERYRQATLDRARACSALTIPSLIPPDGFTEMDDLPTPYQSMGARGVNNLAAKLLLALLPPSVSFFRLALGQKFLDQIEDDEKSKADLALSKGEQRVLQEVERRKIRASGFEIFKHLVVGGNALMYLPEEDGGSFRMFPISQYVVSRDPAGNVLEIIVKEVVDVMRLPEAVRKLVEKKRQEQNEDGREEDVDVYTHVKWDGKRWRVCQEVLGEEISEGFYPKDKTPWQPLRLTAVAGQDYGRGHCEEYFGDLSSLDALEKDVLETAAVCASGRWMVNPNSGLDVEALNESRNWSFVEGDPESIRALQAEKFADMKVVADEISRIESRLQYAFLLHSAVQRNAERVTAEEIKFVAGELEETLGGVYSVMSAEFQLPLVTILIAQMQKAGKFPALPKDALEPIITTGLDALGRSRQAVVLDEFLQSAVDRFGPAVIAFISMSEYLTRQAAARGIDPSKLVKTEQEVQAAQQQQAAQQLTEKLGPAAIKGVSDNQIEMQRQQAAQENAE